ncbi:hypothetical protein B9Z55_000076 [Caenorhabditis nigoni]|uniref:Uncharacterized protein n=1 Tax=Caenorhabditis nigoni TaxID=1611254 RepID=A0A2G5VV30_9PELO|nr:hypothetical protein B9Z55_000076 [Caenorhabditis nigoni]
MWGSTWHLNFAQNGTSPILMKFVPDVVLSMGSILAKFQNSISPSPCLFRNTKKAAKIASKSIFSEKPRAAKRHKDGEIEI